MNAAYLSPSELEYELSIRDLHIDGIEAKRRALRNILREEIPGKTLSPKSILINSTEEYQTVKRKFEELTKIPKSQRKQEERLYNTKFIHLLARIERLLTLKISEETRHHCQLMILDLKSLLKEQSESYPIKEKSGRNLGIPAEINVQDNQNATSMSNEQLQKFQNAVQRVVNISKQFQSPMHLDNRNSRKERDEPIQYYSTADENDEASPDVQGIEGIVHPNSNSSFRFHADQKFKSIPVHKWGIKFSGDGKGLKLTEFLAQVKVLAQTEGVSRNNLHRYAFYLFSSNALNWYRAFYNNFQTWDDLVNALRQEFLPADHDFWTYKEINNRFQKRDETFGLYLASMELLFQQLLEPASEEIKLKTVMRNMRPFYMERLSLIEVNSLT